MNRFTIVLLALTLSGCQTFVEVGAGKHGNVWHDCCWEDSDGVGAYLGVRLEREYGKNWRGVCAYSHYSHYDVGHPFNNKPESSLDAFNCSIGYNITGDRQ